MSKSEQPASKSSLQTFVRLLAGIRFDGMSGFAVVFFIVAVTSLNRSLGDLDAVLFNYYNNTTAPLVIFYFNGWIHLLPEIIAFLSHGLPVAVQFAIYFGFALIVAVVMLQELQKLLRYWFEPDESMVLAFVVLLYFQFCFPVLDQLVWSIWPLVIAASCHILRKNIAGEAYSRTGLAATAIACVSNPTAVVFIPLLIAFSLAQSNTILRRQDLALATLLIAFFTASVVFKPANIHYLPPENPIISAARILWLQVEHPSVRAAFSAAAILVLAWLFCAAIFSKRRADPESRAVFALAYLGCASLALMLFSERAEMLRTMPSRSMTIPARYTIVCVIAALLALAIHMANRLDARTRRRAIAAIALAVAVSELYLLGARLHGSARQVYTQFLFARDAEHFRKTCRPGEALARFYQGPRHLAVLCALVDVGSRNAIVVRRDNFGNAFVQGPTAAVWHHSETVTVQLLAPGR